MALTKGQAYYRRHTAYVDQLATAAGMDPKHCVGCGKAKTGKKSLHWHHRNPKEKSFVLSDTRIRTDAEIVAELQKCDRLCKACHGRLHSVAAQGSVRPHPKGQRYTLNMNFLTKIAAEEARQILLNFKRTRGE